MRISHGGPQVRVTHGLLDLRDVLAGREPRRDASMPEIVRVPRRVDLRSLGGGHDAPAKRRDPLSPLMPSGCDGMREHPPITAMRVAIGAERPRQQLGHRDESAFATLCPVAAATTHDCEKAIVEVHILPPHPEGLRLIAEPGLTEKDDVQV